MGSCVARHLELGRVSESAEQRRFPSGESCWDDQAQQRVGGGVERRRTVENLRFLGLEAILGDELPRIHNPLFALAAPRWHLMTRFVHLRVSRCSWWKRGGG